MSALTQKVDIAHLQTESRNPRSIAIDRISTRELCQILNREDASISLAIEPCISIVAEVIDVLSERVRNGGRVFYIGAGTSGRLGVLDASEIPPTYSAPKNQFVALIAGGDHALRHAKEGAEDSRTGAAEDLEPFHINPEVDSLIGIASSGRTPYVLGGLEHAKSLGCVTVGVVCVQPSAVHDEGKTDYVIAAVTGPEVVTGSTRMKAGTATKLVLNMISTGIMIKLGKTYGNLMVDLKATNLKLIQRAKNMIRYIADPECALTDEGLSHLLQTSRGSVKLAALAATLKISVTEAEERLDRNYGVLARVFDEEQEKCQNTESQDEGLVLCVDAGGTSCKAVVMAKDGSFGLGLAGPCNVSSIGLDDAMSSISQAVQDAIGTCEATKGRLLPSIHFASAWVGIAGYDRPALSLVIDDAVSELLKMPIGEHLKVTADIDMLPVAVNSKSHLDTVIVLVAGTGSIAISYKRNHGNYQRTNRAGGWGHLLGDDGSGYSIGREAFRKALHASDLYRMRGNAGTILDCLPPLPQAIFSYLKVQYPDCEPGDLLSAVLMPDSRQQQAREANSGIMKRISGAARVVLDMAAADQNAKQIALSGATSLAELVELLVEAEGIHPTSSGLVLAGGLMQNEMYKKFVIEETQTRVGNFEHIESVAEPALVGARFLIEALKKR